MTLRSMMCSNYPTLALAYHKITKSQNHRGGGSVISVIKCDKVTKRRKRRKRRNDKYEHASQMQFAPSSTCPLVCLSACLQITSQERMGRYDPVRSFFFIGKTNERTTNFHPSPIGCQPPRLYSFCRLSATSITLARVLAKSLYFITSRLGKSSGYSPTSCCISVLASSSVRQSPTETLK